jgi:hypothetical protein
MHGAFKRLVGVRLVGDVTPSDVITVFYCAPENANTSVIIMSNKITSFIVNT